MNREEFIKTFCPEAKPLTSAIDVLKFALNEVLLEGIYLELGVYKGDSIKLIASMTPSKTIYGFDSFEGLPEDWIRGGHVNYVKGYFAFPEYESLFELLPSNVVLIKGWFEKTLPTFIQRMEKPLLIAFLHIDCDLYSSTSYAFHILGDLIQPGTVIVFDELYGYPGYENHELKAFLEFLEQYSFKAKALAYNMHHEQVAVQII